MKKIITIMTLFILGSVIHSKGAKQIRVKTTYKRSKKIWGVYTQKKQVWFKGKKKHRVGAKNDQVLMRRDGKLVFIGPKFESGVLSYDVLEVPYKENGRKKIKVEKEHLSKLELNSLPVIRSDDQFKTISFKCKNKWSTIECTHILTESN